MVDKKIQDLDALLNLSRQERDEEIKKFKLNIEEESKKIFIGLPKCGSEYYEKIVSGKNAESFKNNLYTNKDIRKFCSISSIQISHWLQSSVIKPFQDSIGRGKVKQFSHRNLIEFMICRELNRFGLSIHIMREVIEYLQTTTFIFHISACLSNYENKHLRDMTGTIWNLYKTLGPIGGLMISLWPGNATTGKMRCAILNHDAIELWMTDWQNDAQNESPQGIMVIRLHSLLTEAIEKLEKIKK